MARVYRAEHLEMARPVAIKVLNATHSGDREAVLRFQREAAMSGRLVHANIVTVTDSGVLDDASCSRRTGPTAGEPESVEWFRAVLAAPLSDAERRQLGIAVRASALAG